MSSSTRTLEGVRYLYHGPDDEGTTCFESHRDIGSCDRTDRHFTHKAYAANGRLLGCWRVRLTEDLCEDSPWAE